MKRGLIVTQLDRDGYMVTSESGETDYLVRIGEEPLPLGNCPCADFGNRVVGKLEKQVMPQRLMCKHAAAVWRHRYAESFGVFPKETE